LDAAQNGSMLRLLCVTNTVNSDVEREQAQQIEFAIMKARKVNFK